MKTLRYIGKDARRWGLINVDAIPDEGPREFDDNTAARLLISGFWEEVEPAEAEATQGKEAPDGEPCD